MGSLELVLYWKSPTGPMGLSWKAPLPVVPCLIIDKIRTITYMFIWGKQHEVALRSMVYPRREGGLGIRDFKQFQISAIIERTSPAWTNEEIWTNLVRSRYIKNSQLQELTFRPKDSFIWKAALRNKETTLGRKYGL